MMFKDHGENYCNNFEGCDTELFNKRYNHRCAAQRWSSMPMFYKFDYAIRNEANEVIDSSEGGESMSFVEGDGTMISGLEKALAGRSIGDDFSVTLGPDEAYGWPQRQLIRTISRDMIQSDAKEIQPGMIFQIGSGHDSSVVKVVSVEEDGITVDSNHPLAGITFNFDIHVLEARQAEPGESQG